MGGSSTASAPSSPVATTTARAEIRKRQNRDSARRSREKRKSHLRGVAESVEMQSRRVRELDARVAQLEALVHKAVKHPPGGSTNTNNTNTNTNTNSNNKHARHTNNNRNHNTNQSGADNSNNNINAPAITHRLHPPQQQHNHPSSLNAPAIPTLSRGNLQQHHAHLQQQHHAHLQQQHHASVPHLPHAIPTMPTPSNSPFYPGITAAAAGITTNTTSVPVLPGGGMGTTISTATTAAVPNLNGSNNTTTTTTASNEAANIITTTTTSTPTTNNFMPNPLLGCIPPVTPGAVVPSALPMAVSAPFAASQPAQSALAFALDPWSMPTEPLVSVTNANNNNNNNSNNNTSTIASSGMLVSNHNAHHIPIPIPHHQHVTNALDPYMGDA